MADERSGEAAEEKGAIVNGVAIELHPETGTGTMPVPPLTPTRQDVRLRPAPDGGGYAAQETQGRAQGLTVIK